jgi:hypothetical protein
MLVDPLTRAWAERALQWYSCDSCKIPSFSDYYGESETDSSRVPKMPIDMFYHRARVYGWLLRWSVIFLFAAWLLRRWKWLQDFF